jgi:hypothetical protein
VKNWFHKVCFCKCNVYRYSVVVGPRGSVAVGPRGSVTDAAADSARNSASSSFGGGSGGGFGGGGGGGGGGGSAFQSQASARPPRMSSDAYRQPRISATLDKDPEAAAAAAAASFGANSSNGGGDANFAAGAAVSRLARRHSLEVMEGVDFLRGAERRRAFIWRGAVQAECS